MRVSVKLASAILVLAIGGMLGACSDTEQLAEPPIPVLAEPSAGVLEPTQRLIPGPRATCSCVQWSCMGDCGYDPPTDGRGACCVLYNCEQSTGVSKPSCSATVPFCSPPGACSWPGCEMDPMGGEWGVDYCLDESPNCTCPIDFACCFGGPFEF